MTHRDVLARFVLVTALSAEAAAGQAQRTGAIGGRVVDARTGTGLARVLVQVEDGGPAAQTDEEGAFLLSGVAPGQRQPRRKNRPP